MAIVKELTGRPNIGTLTATELVSDIPKFDFERAKQAASRLRNKGIPNFPALNLALALRIYNQIGIRVEEAFYPVISRSYKLINDEVTMSDAKNPLPTIGFEVESPSKPFDSKGDTIGYKFFFDAIGMPRNKVNAGEIVSTFWEFSPPPSYCAAVQRRILHELLEGGFIPSLRYSQKPEDIREYLDDKLVSLHLNLGIPNRIERELPNFGNDPDVLLFSSMFAYAFTSPLRLQHRSQQVFANIKEADQTKKGGGQNKRLELKAFEVRSETTYRLMEEVQLLAAALFAYTGDYEEDLALAWRKVSEQAGKVYERYGVEANILKDNKTKAAEVASNLKFVRILRHIITASALNIRGLINLP